MRALEKDIIAKFNQLDDEAKQRVLRQLQRIYERQKQKDDVFSKTSTDWVNEVREDSLKRLMGDRDDEGKPED